jgi:hypothetical protein
MNTHEQIQTELALYLSESANFEGKGVKASAARARQALLNLSKLAKTRRQEIQDTKNAM